MNELELLADLHRDTERQGPGGQAHGSIFAVEVIVEGQWHKVW